MFENEETRGRKPEAGVPRDCIINIRVTFEERQKIQRAALEEGLPVSEKVRPYMLKWARRVLG